MTQRVPRVWRGCAEIRTATEAFSAPWPFGVLIASQDTFEFHAFWRSIIVREADVVELRFYDLPIPSFVVIFRSGDYFARASFGMLRGRLLRSAIQDFGFSISKSSRMRPMGDFLKDTVDYGLFNGPRLDGSVGKRHDKEAEVMDVNSP